MSKRARKNHIQEPLPFPKRGGKRKGAGRPKKGFRASERHKKREALPARCPAHVTLRVEGDRLDEGRPNINVCDAALNLRK
jgi:hypothetical protein